MRSKSGAAFFLAAVILSDLFVMPGTALAGDGRSAEDVRKEESVQDISESERERTGSVGFLPPDEGAGEEEDWENTGLRSAGLEEISLEDAAPEDTASEDTEREGAASEDAIGENVASEDIVGKDADSDEGAGKDVALGETVGEDADSDDGAEEDAAPEETAGENAASEDTVGEDAIPEDIAGEAGGDETSSSMETPEEQDSGTEYPGDHDVNPEGAELEGAEDGVFQGQEESSGTSGEGENEDREEAGAAADKTALVKELNRARGLLTQESIEKNRFEESAVWDLEGAVSLAELVVENPDADQNEVDEAWEILRNMEEELLNSARTEERMKERAAALLDAYAEYYQNPECFTERSFAYFASVYEALRQMLGKGSIKIYEYEAMMEELHEAVSQLEMREAVFKEELEDLLGQILELEPIWNCLSKAYALQAKEACDEAEELLKNLRVTQEEVDAAAAHLQELLENLELKEGKEKSFYQYFYEESEKERYPDSAYTQESIRVYRRGRNALKKLFEDTQIHSSEEWQKAWAQYEAGFDQLNLKNEFSPAVIDLREIYEEYVWYLQYPERYTELTFQELQHFIRAVERADLDKMTDLEAQELLDEAGSISWVYSAEGLRQIAERLKARIDSMEREGIYGQNWIDLLRSFYSIIAMDVRTGNVEYEVLEEVSGMLTEIEDYLRGMEEYELMYLDAEVMRRTILEIIQSTRWTEFMEQYEAFPEKYYWLTRESAADAFRQAEESVDQDSYYTKEDYLGILTMLRAAEDGIILTMDMAPLWLDDAREFLKKEKSTVGKENGLSKEDYDSFAALAKQLKQGISAGDEELLENTQKEILQFEQNLRRISGKEVSVTPEPDVTVSPEPSKKPEPTSEPETPDGGDGTTEHGQGEISGEDDAKRQEGTSSFTAETVNTSDPSETEGWGVLLFFAACALVFAPVCRRRIHHVSLPR